MQKLIDWTLSLYIFLSLIVIFLFSNISNENSKITYKNVIFSLAIICFISLLSYISTWRKLNGYYGTDLESPDRVQLFRSGRVGFVSYGNCLKIGLLDNGVYLSNLLGALAIFNKPLSIPWSDITDVYKKGDTYELKIKNATFSTKISLPINSLKDADDILETKIKS